MAIRRFVVPVTVNAAGDATAYSPTLYGLLVSISYVKTDYANGVDFVITTETGGETLWSELNVNASTTRYPRVGTHSTAGVASLYAAGGTAVQARVGVGGDRVKIVVAQGGVSTSGAFHIVIEG
jgi:hypothetical protein